MKKFNLITIVNGLGIAILGFIQQMHEDKEMKDYIDEEINKRMSNL